MGTNVLSSYNPFSIHARVSIQREQHTEHHIDNVRIISYSYQQKEHQVWKQYAKSPP